jgi:hypothetical protein
LASRNTARDLLPHLPRDGHHHSPKTVVELSTRTQIANHRSPPTTKPYQRINAAISPDEIERILIWWVVCFVYGHM